MSKTPGSATKALAKVMSKRAQANKEAPPDTKPIATSVPERPRMPPLSESLALTIWDTENRRSRMKIRLVSDGSVILVYFPKRAPNPGGATYISKSGVRKVAALYASQPFVDQLILTDPTDRKCKTVIDCHGIGLNIGKHFFHIPTGPKQRANLAKFFAWAKGQV